MEWLNGLIEKFNIKFRRAKVHTVTPEITWPAPPPICYPGKLTKQHYMATCSIEGVFEFEPGPGATLPVGDYELVATFLPLDPELQQLVKVHKISVEKAVPNVAWKQPLPICEGTALNSKQLNATCVNLAGGEYEYKPSARHKLPIGTHILTCTYLPSHEYRKNYADVQISVELLVEEMKTPVILWGGTRRELPEICYGTAVSRANILTAKVLGFDGRMQYEPEEGCILQAGANQNIRATFLPTNRNAIKSVWLDLKLNVQRAVPVIDWPAPEPIYEGTTMSGTQLCASNALIPNTHAEFVYTPALGETLPAGNQFLFCKFTADPNIASNYETVTVSVPLIVLPKKLPLLIWGVGQKLAADAETKTGPDPEPELLRDRGEGEEKGSAAAEAEASAHIAKQVQSDADEEKNMKSSFPPPAPAPDAPTWHHLGTIPYGMEISRENVANAFCSHYLEHGVRKTDDSFGGDISYSVKSGALLEPGMHIITATFKPWNSVEYEDVVMPLQLEVLWATPLIVWTPPRDMLKNVPLGEAELNAHIEYDPRCSSRVRTKLKCHKLGSLSYDPPAGSHLHVGSYDLKVTFTPHEQYANHYTTTTGTVRLNVVKPNPAIMWDNPLPDMYLGHALTKHQLNAVCTEVADDEGIVTGSFEYDPPIGTLLPLGKHILSVRFTVSGEFHRDYADLTQTTMVNVCRARQPTLTWVPPADISYNTPLSNKHLTCICDVYEGFLLYDPPVGAILEAGLTHTLKCTFIPDDELHWLTVDAAVSINVLKSSPTLSWSVDMEFYSGMSLAQRHLCAYVNESHLEGGTMSYSPGLGAVLATGTHTLKAMFAVPAGWRHRYHNITMDLTLVVVPKIVPSMIWVNSAHLMDWDEIVYGYRLTKKQLNVKVDLPGEISYDPPAQTLLDATEGAVLHCTFTPDDLDKYLVTTIARKLLVKPAVPYIEWVPKLPFMYVGKGDRADLGIREHTLNAFTTTVNAADGHTVVTGKCIYCPEMGTKLPVGEHCMTVIFEPDKAFSRNYTFATKFIIFLVIPEGSLFKIPKRYTEPEVRPTYKDPKQTLLHPPQAGVAGDFYWSDIETQMDSDLTRRILEARAEAKRKAEEGAVEAAMRGEARKGVKGSTEESLEYEMESAVGSVSSKGAAGAA